MLRPNQIRATLRLMVLFLVLFSSLAGFGQVDSLLREIHHATHIDSTLISCRKYLRQNKAMDDSIKLACMDSIIHFCKSHELKKWEYRYTTFKTKVLLHQKHPMEAIELAFQVLDEMGENSKWTSIAANNYQTISIGFESIGAYREAIHYRKKELAKLGKKKFSQRNLNALNTIGKLHLNLQEFDSAILFYQKTLEYTSQLPAKTNHASAYNNIGLVYFEQREFDSAEVNFLAALDLFQQGHSTTDSIMQGIVGGNLAQCYPIAGNKELIVSLLKKNIAVTREHHHQSSHRNAYFILGNLYYETNELALSKYYLDSALYINNTLPNNFEKLAEEANIYEAYISIYERLNNPKKQVAYWRKLNATQNAMYGRQEFEKIQQLLTENQVSNISNQLELEKAQRTKSEQEVQILTAETAVTRLRLILLAGAFLIIIAVLIGYYWTRKKAYERQKNMDALSKKVLETENQLKSERLAQSAISLQRKSEFSQELIGKLRHIKNIKPSDISELKVFISTELQVDQGLLEKEELITTLDQTFYTNLHLKHPTLTETDKKLCGLIVLNLSIKEIAVIRNITPNSVKIAKNRLSKKLGLAPGTKLGQYLTPFVTA